MTKHIALFLIVMTAVSAIGAAGVVTAQRAAAAQSPPDRQQLERELQQHIYDIKKKIGPVHPIGFKKQ